MGDNLKKIEDFAPSDKGWQVIKLGGRTYTGDCTVIGLFRVSIFCSPRGELVVDLYNPLRDVEGQGLFASADFKLELEEVEE